MPAVRKARRCLGVQIWNGGGAVVDEVALDGLGWEVPDGVGFEGAEELDVLGVSPDEGHAGAGGVAVEEEAVGDVFGVPDLFGGSCRTRWSGGRWF